MALVYLDTSALVKLFVQEQGSYEVLALARPDAGHTLALLEITRVELYSAIYRRERSGDVPTGTARNARDVLDRHARTYFVVQRLTEVLLDRACALVERHALRAYDALQLAGGIEASGQRDRSTTTFVTADKSLALAATAEGLRVFDPAQPGASL